MTLLRGVLASFDASAYRADIWLEGATAHITSGVAVSRGLPSGELTAGRPVLIDTGHEADAARFVVVAVWDEA